MTKSLQRLLAVLTALCLTFTLIQPGIVLADDDDDWEEDGGYEEVDDDDDDWDDDDWEFDDDDWDDDVPAAPAPPAQAPAAPVVDDDDWDDDLEGYGDEEDDLPISGRAIVQLSPDIDPGSFADRYGAEVIRTIPGPNIVLLGIGENLAAMNGAGISSFAQSDDDNDDIDDDIDDQDDDDVDSDDDLADDTDDDDRVEQPAIDDDFYSQYNVRDDRRADMTALINDPDVVWAEFNFTSRAPEGRPRYFFASMNGEPEVVDAPALPQGLEMDTATVCTTGDSVIVAVLDTGVDVTHPAIAANVMDTGVNMLEISWDVSDTGNGIDDDGDGQIDEMVGHGTHVSGTILQIAPDAQILPVKVLDSDGFGDTFSITAGIIYAMEQGADVINLSLGSTWDSAAISWAVAAAEEQGVVVVAAAGNGNREAPVEYPASNAGVISVAATDATGDKAEYSNYNQYVDISAPGNDVASAYPGGIYTTASGTSMSAPVVTGGIALMLERSPEMAPQIVRDRVFDAAAPLNLSDPALDGMMGGGQIDIDATLVCGG